jgi:hypothetical protein
MHRTLLPVLAAVLGACGGETPPAPPADPLPCFADAGPAVAMVDGVPIPAGALERAAAAMRFREPGLSELSARRRALDEVLIPEAVLYGYHRARLPQISAEIRELAARLRGGTPWPDLVAAVNGHPDARRTGGSYGWQAIGPGVPSQLPLLLEDAARRLGVGEASDSFFCSQGAMIVRVAGERPGRAPSVVERELQVVVVPYDLELAEACREGRSEAVEARARAFKELKQRLSQAARVSEIHPGYESLVYPYRKR